MHKRKIVGILKYGTRVYTGADKTPKFQEGGSVAVSRGYDWRDDPYEIMLLRQKTAQEIEGTRAAAKAERAAKPTNYGLKSIDTFDALKEGLPVTNRQINAIAEKEEEAYYDKVRQSGGQYAATMEGQIEFKKLANHHTKLETAAKEEAENFKTALSAIDPSDRNTLAVSAEGGVMVRDTSGKGGRVSMSDYLANTDKFSIMKINEFADWKKNEDTGLQSNLIDEFLKSNPVGDGTFKKTFIDPKQDMIKYAFKNNQLVLKAQESETGKDEYVMDAGQFKAGLNNLLMNQGFYTGTDVQESSQNPNKQLDVVNSIYTDIMNGASSRSQLEASLTAEALSSNAVVANIASKSTLKEKQEYLDNYKKNLLVKKIVDPNTKSSDGGSSSGDDVKNKPKTSAFFGDMLAIFDPTELEQYTIGVGVTPAQGKKVNDVNMPTIKGAISPSDLALELDPKADPTKKSANNILTNKAISVYTDNNEFYLPDGTRLSKVLGSNAEARNFLGDDTVIAKNQSCHITYVPMDDKNNVMIKESLAMAPLKMSVRRRFLESVKGKLTQWDEKTQTNIPYTISTKAEDLLPGNIDPKAQSDLNEFYLWLEKGTDYRKYQQKAKEGGADKMNAYLMAKDAAESIKGVSIAFDKVFKGRKTHMQPMLVTNIVFDDDDKNVKESIDKLTAAGGFGAGLVKEASASDKAFLQDTNGIDHTNFNVDHVYTMPVFTKLKSLPKVAAEQGENAISIAQFNTINDKIKGFVDRQQVTSNPGEYSLIKQYLML
jgi:hypothetical protein